MNNLTLIFKNLLDTCIVSSIMILFIFLVKNVVRNKISANIIYFLFLLLLIRLVFPFSIQSEVSIENLYHDTQVTQFSENYRDENVEVDYSSISKEIYKPVEDNSEKVYRVLTYIWLFGIFAVMFIPIISYRTLKKELSKEKNAVNDIVSKASIDARTKLDITTSFRVVYSYYLDAPALIGVLRPMIVLPMNKKDADYDTIYYILLHEFVHYKKSHLFFQWIFWIIKAIYWFNPLVWLAHMMMKHEAEFACDEEVMKIIGEDNKKEYGNLLIDLADNINNKNYTVNAAGLLNNKSELKSRILRLSKKINQSGAVRYISAILIIIMLPVFFTSYAIEELEIVEKIIEKDIDTKPLISDNISFDLNKYEYNTKTEKLLVFLNYEINDKLYEKLKVPNKMSLHFELQFPGSVDPEIREKGYSTSAYSNIENTNKGQICCEFELDKYNQDKYGKAKLVFEGAQITREFSKMQEIKIDKKKLPIIKEIDDLFSVKYHYLSQGQEKNNIDIKYNVESPSNIRVSFDEQYFVESGDALSRTSGNSSNRAQSSGTSSSSLTRPSSVSGSISEKQYNMTLGFNTTTENIDTVIMRIKSYTIHLGMNQAMFSNNQDIMALRFDITIGDGDIEYE